MQENIRENKMGTMPVGRLLFNMAAPMAMSMLVQALYNIVDSIYVSRLSEEALSAVSLAFPVQNIMMALASGIAVGVNAMLSRALGQKDFDRANRYAGAGVFLECAAMVLMMLFGLFFARKFFSLQTNDPVIVSYGADYLFFINVFSAGVFGQVLFERLLSSTGRTVYAMITQMTGAVINIILDPILIFGYLGFPAMGTMGAAIATVVGQWAAAILAFIFNARLNHDIHFKFRYFLPRLEFVGKILAVGVPSMVMMMVGSVMNFGMNQILLSFSATAVAVFGVYYKIQSFAFMPVFGLNNAMVPIVAYNYGARNKARIMRTVKLSIIAATCLMMVGIAAFMLIPDKLLALYNASEQMQTIGQPALRITSLSFTFAGFCIVTGSVFQALGNGVYSLIVSVARQLLVLLPVAYLFSLTGNLTLVWYAFPIAELMSVAVSGALLRRIYVKKIKFLSDKSAQEGERA